MPFYVLLFRKWTARSPFSLKSQIKLAHMILLILAHIDHFFSMWPASQKELPTPGLGQQSLHSYFSKLFNVKLDSKL
jgi:hypothetical protein